MRNEPSLFASEACVACGSCALRLGGGLDAAAALGAAVADGGGRGGTAEPGALFGNLRMVLCAADLDAPEPIVTWWAFLSRGEGVFPDERRLLYPCYELYMTIEGCGF
jgi:hypothetical protein